MNIDAIKLDLEKLLYIAGDIIAKWFIDTKKDVRSKTDANDLLTKYDVAVNTMILEHLQTNYPTISIISEEAPEIKKESDFAFVVDPIDGTRNFVRHIPVFFVGIALVKNNKTILSITYNPMTKELFHAIKGKWAYVNWEKISVSTRTLDLSDVIVRWIPNKKLEKQVVSNIIEHVHQVKNNMCCHEEISWVACESMIDLFQRALLLGIIVIICW